MSDFNLEWAKRGGVVAVELQERVLLCQLCFGHLMYLDEIPKFLAYAADAKTRMATLEECKAAGVEYIPPPAHGEVDTEGGLI